MWLSPTLRHATCVGVVLHHVKELSPKADGTEDTKEAADRPSDFTTKPHPSLQLSWQRTPSSSCLKYSPSTPLSVLSHAISNSPPDCQMQPIFLFLHRLPRLLPSVTIFFGSPISRARRERTSRHTICATSRHEIEDRTPPPPHYSSNPQLPEQSRTTTHIIATLCISRCK